MEQANLAFVAPTPRSNTASAGTAVVIFETEAAAHDDDGVMRH
jgi:hypothetical protein